MDIDLRRIQEYFATDLFAGNSGAVVDHVTPESVQCSMELTPLHANAGGGGVHGGAIFTLAAFAFAVHANWPYACGEPIGRTVGQSLTISFLKGAKGQRLIARTACLSKGRTMSVYRVSITDDLGTRIAELQANGFTTAPKD
ncbi:MAG: PaaI family thioesterase [Peptococcaceae bacterium]|jgi:acyl-CoA thioesterase|nr:PaaI family thioesterase [Peptococcaceae bacterium]